MWLVNAFGPQAEVNLSLQGCYMAARCERSQSGRGQGRLDGPWGGGIHPLHSGGDEGMEDEGGGVNGDSNGHSRARLIEAVERSVWGLWELRLVGWLVEVGRWGSSKTGHWGSTMVKDAESPWSI